MMKTYLLAGVLLAATSPALAEKPYFRFQAGPSASPGEQGGPGLSQNTVRGTGDLTVYGPIQVRGRPAVPFSLALRALDPQGALTWSSVGDPLPAGLSLSQDGILSGMPETVGSAPAVRLRAVDASGRTGTTEPFLIDIPPVPLVSVEAQGPIKAGTAPSVSVSATNVYGTRTWSLADGVLPKGLSVDPATGALLGSPIQEGNFEGIILAVKDADGAIGRSAPFDLHVYSQPIIALSPTKTSYRLRVGDAFSLSGQPFGITGTPTWSLNASDGTLPPDLSFQAPGSVSGIIRTAGVSSFTLSARDGDDGQVANSPGVTLDVADTPSIGGLTVSYAGRVDKPMFTDIPYATSIRGNATYALSPAAPAGMVFGGQNAGVLSGTPTQAVNQTYAVTVTDDWDGRSSTATYALRVFEALAFSAQPSAWIGPVNAAATIDPPGIVQNAGTLSWALLNGTTEVSDSLGSLCPSLGFNKGTGQISGSASGACSLTLSYLAKDDGGTWGPSLAAQAQSQTFALKIVSNIAFSTSPQTINVNQSETATSTGALSGTRSGNLAWSVIGPSGTSTDVPAWISVSSCSATVTTCSVSASPDTTASVATYPAAGAFVLQATDASGAVAQSTAFTVRVSAAAKLVAGSAIFTAGTTTWTPPRPNLPVRYLVMGGGSAGVASDSFNRGGGSGNIVVGTMVANGSYTVTVGVAGTPTTSGGTTTFGSITAAGSFGKDGWSGAGGRGYSTATYDGYAGGSNGSWGVNNAAGTGTGAVNLSQFKVNSVTAGAGGVGSYGTQTGLCNEKVFAGSGGGGGVKIGASWPSGIRGGNFSGYGGEGYGAGGSGQSAVYKCGSAPNYPGGNGAPGVVYVEWDGQ